MQSSWHNVPEVAGSAQGVGASFAARDAAETITDAASSLSLDIAGAYPDGAVSTWRRTATLDRTAGAVHIDDAWDLGHGDPDPEHPTTIHLIVAGEVTLGRGGAHVQPLEGATPVLVRWNPEVPARLEVRELDDPMLSSVWGARLVRIVFDVSTCRELRVTVEEDPSTPGDQQ